MAEGQSRRTAEEIAHPPLLLLTESPAFVYTHTHTHTHTKRAHTH